MRSTNLLEEHEHNANMRPPPAALSEAVRPGDDFLAECVLRPAALQAWMFLCIHLLMESHLHLNIHDFLLNPLVRGRQSS